MNIAVYGFMGVGKTTVGALLGEKLGLPVVDMDAEIEQRVGSRISDIFEYYGEPYFRELESALVHELCKTDEIIIACGGGTVVDEENAEVLKAAARMVYLTASMDEIVKRTRGDDSRPLLDAQDSESGVIRLFEARKPIYERYAEVTVDTTGLEPQLIVEQILEALK